MIHPIMFAREFIRGLLRQTGLKPVSALSTTPNEFGVVLSHIKLFKSSKPV